MKLAQITPNPDFTLQIVSDDNRIGIFDVKPYLNLPAFTQLKNPADFAKLINGSYFVEWECGADLSADTIEAHWRVG